MSFELVLNFTPDGAVDAMHMDRFDLGFLGKKHVQRATEIKFDDESQLWGLYLPMNPGSALALWHPVGNGQGFRSYEIARDFEVAWLNVCRFRDVDPQSHWGEVALKVMRHLGAPVDVETFFKLNEDFAGKPNPI